MGKTGVIVQARMGSSRLPGKVLEKIGGLSVLATLLIRLQRCRLVDSIIVASTNKPEDAPIIELAESMGAGTFAGSENDVLDRYYRAGQAFNLDTIIRATADCPLLDPLVIDDMIETFFASDCVFLSNSEPLPSLWPDGMDISVFSREALVTAWANATLPSEREHVTFYFHNNVPEKCMKVGIHEDLSHVRLTLDYPEDLLVLNEISRLARVSLNQELVDLSMADILGLLQIEPNIMALNSMYSRGLGWENSFRLDAEFSNKKNQVS
jgi:spore coat polysaccharide biosynthesis protein SpsF (cytidylyltransferase family)